MSCFFIFFIFLVPFGNTRNRTELPDPETELPETELGTDRFQFLSTRITRIPEEPNRSVSGTRMTRVLSSPVSLFPKFPKTLCVKKKKSQNPWALAAAAVTWAVGR
jgi:hypothetical protein